MGGTPYALSELVYALSAIPGGQTQIQELLWRAHVLPHQHEPLPGKVPVTVMRRAWEHAGLEFGLPHLGVQVAGNLPAGALGMIDICAQTSANVADGFHRLTRLGALYSGEGRYHFARRGELHVLSHRASAPLPSIIEFCLGIVLLRARDLSDHRLRPKRITFRHGRSAPQHHYEDVFDCPVEFESNEDAIEFNQDLNELTFETHDPLFCEMAEAHLLRKRTMRLLEEVKEDERYFLEKVEHHLTTCILTGDASANRVAERMGTSTRTLQRRLRASGFSFRQLLKEVQFGVAQEYLVRPGAKQTLAARALGYASPSSFQRAFKAWSGGKLPTEMSFPSHSAAFTMTSGLS